MWYVLLLWKKLKYNTKREAIVRKDILKREKLNTTKTRVIKRHIDILSKENQVQKNVSVIIAKKKVFMQIDVLKTLVKILKCLKSMMKEKRW